MQFFLKKNMSNIVVPISVSEFAGKYIKGRIWQQRFIFFFLSLADWEEMFNDPDLDYLPV